MLVALMGRRQSLRGRKVTVSWNCGSNRIQSKTCFARLCSSCCTKCDSSLQFMRLLLLGPSPEVFRRLPEATRSSEDRVFPT